jgi:hypothetical protein
MIYAHDNYFLNNGTNADTSGDFGLLFLLFGVGTPEMPSEDVIWDGNIRDGVSDPEVCLGSNFTGTFRNMTNNMCADQPNSVVWAGCATDNSTTDVTGRLCDLDPM